MFPQLDHRWHDHRLGGDLARAGAAAGRRGGDLSLGMAGGFLGGAIFSLIADRGVARLDVVSLLVAFVGAAALLGLVSKADYAEPRTR